MDGFYTTNGKTAMGYYKSPDLPYYYSLFPQFTLCANYFCGVLSETYPNRLVLYSGTSRGNTSNNINNGTLNYPCVLDLLSGNGITFKNYNFHCPANLRLIHCPTPAHQAVIPAATLVMNVTAMPLYGHRSHIHDRSGATGPDRPGSSSMASTLDPRPDDAPASQGGAASLPGRTTG